MHIGGFIHPRLSSLGLSTSYASTYYHRESTFKRIRGTCSGLVFFLWEGRLATTGLTPFPPGKDAFKHEPHEEELCKTQAFIAHAAEQATLAPAHYSLKPHPRALTHGFGRSAVTAVGCFGQRTKLQPVQARLSVHGGARG